MIAVLSREEDEEETREPEITLSTASLLGLFLGLVLICGVFFGFGYSVGRRATANAAANAVNNNGAEDSGPEPISPKTSAAATQEDGTGNSSPAANEASSADGNDAADPAAQPVAAPAPGSTITLPVVETPALAPVQKPAAQLAEAAPAAAQPARASSPETAASHAMVQVAAVVHQEDADVLVSALRKRGYSAVVRGGEPQDKLLHIQVGPFATRMEANAMKQKLASDGYNAIIKQ